MDVKFRQKKSDTDYRIGFLNHRSFIKRVVKSTFHYDLSSNIILCIDHVMF